VATVYIYTTPECIITQPEVFFTFLSFTTSREH